MRAICSGLCLYEDLLDEESGQLLRTGTHWTLYLVSTSQTVTDEILLRDEQIFAA